jgi:arylsulfatase A-like enzyme
MPTRPVLLAFVASLPLAGTGLAAVPDWPQATYETKPWTRFWWMGSAVSDAGLRAALEAYRDAGLGGVEITPIYGVRGFEDRFVPYLSKAWLDRLATALTEARRLGLGVDMATGTGWPFGGPWVGADDACKTIAHRTYRLSGGDRLAEPVRMRQEPLLRAIGNASLDGLVEPVEANPNLQALAIDQVRFARELPLHVLMACSDRGEVLDLTAHVDAKGRLDWTAPAGTWTLHALFLGGHGKLVERAAPGGEGNVIDHFAARPIRSYLRRFDQAFAGRPLAGLRAFFNDSYEVDDASGQSDWTPLFFDEFQKRRGYDLRRELPSLLAAEASERSTRVLVDYRETISDLLLDRFTSEWRSWAAGRGRLVRNQAHGSPASILDLYAASDIPETEGRSLYRIKWASSAANLTGKRLVSAEAATWLGEHFVSTLADVRASLDRYFVGGVNHVVYHGTSYTPPGEPWPGWPFYASVHFDPYNSWWSDFPALNSYVTRVQSFLQSGQADNDVLLYFPFHDALAIRGAGRLAHFGHEGRDLPETPFDAAFDTLERRGFAFDLVSDRLLRGARPQAGAIVTQGGAYKALVLPAARSIPLETFAHALDLVHAGATLVAYRGLPLDVPGLHDLDARRTRLRHLTQQLAFDAPDARGVKQARLGGGRVLSGDDLEALLEQAGVARETLRDLGLAFARRRHAGERYYFVANPGQAAVEGWLKLATTARAVALYDPMRGSRGWAAVRPGGADGADVFVQLAAGGSLVIATHAGDDRVGESYPYVEPAGAPLVVEGPWTVRFVRGGPELPAETTTSALGSWTRFGGEAVKSFSGTATYTTSFARPAVAATAAATDWRLDLGQVRASARVRLNGQDLGTLIGPVYQLTIARTLLAEHNVLEIDVTNLMANRAADLDRRQVPWKKFYNVNFPSRLRENRGPDGLFTAARWEPLESGLLGPVTLQPVRIGARAARPNVVLVLADDLGYGELGAYGQAIIRTPHIDRLAREGLRFTDFYAGSTVCAPSRAVLMTGRHTGHVSVRGNAPDENRKIQALREGERTLAHLFRDAGYATALFGKWGLGEVGSPGHPGRMGFDAFFGYLNQRHAHNYYPSFLIRGTERVPLGNLAAEDNADGSGWARVRVDYAHDRIVDEALRWIGEVGARPFFLFLSVTLPHANNEARRATGDGQEVPDYGPYANEAWPAPDKGQAAMVSRLDRDVGRLVAKLEQLGIANDTLVLVSSDNGPHREGGNDPERFDANGPLRGLKRDLYEGGIRVPLVARWPGRVAPGSISSHAGYFGDFFATFAELLGRPAPAGLDSISVLPTLLGRPGEQRAHDYLYWEFYEQGGRQAVRFGPWKAIREPMRTGTIRLYDLASDLGETRDLAAERRDLARRAARHMDQAHVPDPLWAAR